MLSLKKFVENGNKFVVAHRGASLYAPENTLPAVEKAIASGAAMLEIDVQLAKDGTLVTWHDDSLSQILGIDAKISEMTYNEISEIDAGAWFSSEFVGTKIPKLDDVLKLIAGKMYLNIEIKEPKISDSFLLSQLINKVEEYNYIDKSLFCSFYYRLLPIIKFECENSHIAAIRIPKDTTKPSEIRLKYGIDAFICDISEVDEELKFDIVENSIVLGVYGLIDDKSIDSAIANEVSAFASDDPELIMKKLISRKVL